MSSSTNLTKTRTRLKTYFIHLVYLVRSETGRFGVRVVVAKATLIMLCVYILPTLVDEERGTNEKRTLVSNYWGDAVGKRFIEKFYLFFDGNFTASDDMVFFL